MPAARSRRRPPPRPRRRRGRRPRLTPRRRRPARRCRRTQRRRPTCRRRPPRRRRRSQQVQAQPEVELDPNGDVGYGRQDNPGDIAASPDDRHANKVPAYPRGAGLRGEQGTVEMLVTIGAGGQVSSAEVAVSSGHADLDRTAQRAVLGWHFHPAMRGGVAVPTQSMQVFNFEIVGRDR